MFIKSLLFPKGKKLWMVIGLAIFISIVLIIVSCTQILNLSDGLDFKKLFKSKISYNILAMSSYYAEYETTIISNKNRNVYSVNEWYKKSNDGVESFKFEFKNINGKNTTYIINNGELHVKNEAQIYEYILSDYVTKKTNLLSLSTFNDMYNIIKNSEQESKYFIIESSEEDDREYLNIKFNIDGINTEESEIFKKYSDVLAPGMNISSIQVMVDKKTKLPIAMNVFNKENDIYISTVYSTFRLNETFEDKTFAF